MVRLNTLFKPETAPYGLSDSTGDPPNTSTESRLLAQDVAVSHCQRRAKTVKC